MQNKTSMPLQPTTTANKVDDETLNTDQDPSIPLGDIPIVEVNTDPSTSSTALSETDENGVHEKLNGQQERIYRQILSYMSKNCKALYEQVDK